MKKTLLALLLLSIFLIACTPQQKTRETTQQNIPAQENEEYEETTETDGTEETETTPSEEKEETSQPTTQTEVKTFNVRAFRFGFDPSSISVNKGDKVKLMIKSTDVTHGFQIAEYGINERLPPGQLVTVEFTADKTGSFTYRCSVFCGSGHSDMEGLLIVNP